MSIENIVEKGELLDCYGELLTKRQKDCLDLYYNENLTLAEIADYFHISRQAVHDAMRHGEEQLLSYEAALQEPFAEVCLIYMKILQIFVFKTIDKNISFFLKHGKG